MKTLKTTLMASAMLLTAFTSISCKEGNKNEPAAPMSNEMHQESMDDKDDMAMNENQGAKAVLQDYFKLKDALVETNNDKAKQLGATLASTLGSFDASSYSDSEQQELKDIIEDATEHAEHISESDMAHQREHFKILTKDVTDMVAITGTEMNVYEQYCPMYDNNKGGAWLSMNEEIRNPYFGDKMLKCGKVQREIN
ncbi:DUF3347 domain-containing protein [Leeuwenhoekiella palythoae]|uniref:DUF3347 domain-containing protein n=1 Tax=Leeuwenhoekiella palythoae TaxID=573501 RepID=UPI001CE07DDB|nr:DUF3347 domain-containing protein [Leeuwenhoekiella palythoae]UBZ09130.1 DUF3347 domain-containing protein [Leeuwenhoekiella palythoae]|tara:strand:- start:1666 stop:2256 length:591 start_codon:yes stop_codon:yes gene_type:complete